MFRFAFVIAGLALAVAAFAGAASAQTSQLPVTPQPLPPAPPAPALYYGPPVAHPTGGQFPLVVNLRPYTPETNNMSLEGYLRQLVFWQTGKWITVTDAARVVQQQRAK
jgi:hypothetical protein